MLLHITATTAGLVLLTQAVSAFPLSENWEMMPRQDSAFVLIQTKPDPTGLHTTIDWAQERLSEIDATIAILEERASELDRDARAKAEAMIAELRATRDAYQAEFEKAIAEGKEQADAKLEDARAILDETLNDFERGIDAYLETANSEVTLRQEVFKIRLEAQRRYWQLRIAELQESGDKMVGERRAAIDARIAELQAQVAETSARLEELRQVSGEAWAVFRNALSEARELFDRTYGDIQRKFDTK
ncbi:MAG: hypothetical protein KJ587_19980 [Alphaproteobacteria bacterium]|nr:hypothetical protein [Alphaproteobacteria bacterium]